MSEVYQKPVFSNVIMRVLFIGVIVSIMADNYILRKKLTILETGVIQDKVSMEDLNRQFSIDLQKCQDTLLMNSAVLKKNEAEDNRFRAAQTKFDSNAMAIFFENDLIKAKKVP